MALTIPWSVWKMGSLQLFITYVRVDLIMLFIIGGLVCTWGQFNLVMYAFAGGAVVDLLAARLILNEQAFGGRLGLEFGSLANPDDLAGHLLLTLPFLMWVAHSTKSVVVRLLGLAGVAVGISVILRTASRGALIGLVIASLFFLLRGTARQRIALLAGATVLIPVLLVTVPRESLRRITSFSNDQASGTEAAGSTEGRKYLLRKSLEYTLHNPIFGVGAGQFAWAEGTTSRVGGTTHGAWKPTHNSYTQVSSECGIPALILFLCGIVSTFRLLSSTWRQARRRSDCEDIATASFYAMLAMTAFCTAIFFLNFAYFFYLPAMAGLAIALDRTAQAEFSSRAPQALESQQPPWGGPHRGFHAGAGRISPDLARTAPQAAS
jgi:O-antigen ligase